MTNDEIPNDEDEFVIGYFVIRNSANLTPPAANPAVAKADRSVGTDEFPGRAAVPR